MREMLILSMHAETTEIVLIFLVYLCSVGQIMGKYRSGKLPKAFKVVPSLINWEDVSCTVMLYLLFLCNYYCTSNTQL